MSQLTTLLFDLDGTLLPMDNDHFTKGYFKHLLPQLAHLHPVEKLLDQIWKSTEAMVRSDDRALTNEQVFKADFLAAVEGEEAEYWSIFERFYAGPFGELSHLSSPTPLARLVVQAALDKGYRVVLATNPLFPRAAIEHRMRWANIHDLPFDLVTDFETMHYCKPNPNYYREILQKIEVAPESSMMIGNDAFEDLIAGQLGMKTFWITDCAIESERGLPYDHKGTMAELLRYIQEELPSVR